MAASGGRPDASDDPTDVRLGGRPPAAGAVLQGRPTEADGCPVRRGPSAIAVHRKPSIWDRPPAPSALYDSNFSFLHYVFAFLIAVTWSNSILEKLVENSL
jgi:hypothetical protein